MMACIFDTETTGLISNGSIRLDKQPRIIDLYAAKVNLKQGKIIREFEALLNPGIPIPPDPKKITGIDDDMVKDCPQFDSPIAEQFLSIVNGCACAIAHNATYDKEIIDFEFKRQRLPPIRWPRLICTVEQTVHLLGFRLSLDGLYKHLFNEEFQDAHRAKPDSQALIRCSIELFKRGLI